MNGLLKLFKNLNERQRRIFIISGGVFIFTISLFIAIALIKSNVYSEPTVEVAIVDRSDVIKVEKSFQKAGLEFFTSNKNGKIVISVNESDYNKANLKVSTLDISVEKLKGYKIFEDPKLGKSSFDNNINYIRALEEEIQISINTLEGVVSSKVKVSLPKETLFITKLSEPKASVIIEMENGRSLNRKQISGIKNFIANSVEKLKITNVELINSNGVSLENSEEGGMYTMAQEQMKYKNDVEQKLKEKILMNLSPVVGGSHNITAEITIDFDFNKKDSYEEIYDPNSVVRSVQNKNFKENTKKEEKINGGVPGVVSNIAKDPSKIADKNNIVQDKKQVEDVTNFEISKKVINTSKKRYGDILRIGAAITFNTNAFKKEDLKNVNEKIKNIVKSAINYEGDRGDQISVEGFSFFVHEKEETTKEKIETVLGILSTFIDTYADAFKLLFAILLLIFFYRKFILGVSDVKITDKEDQYESTEEVKLKKAKRDSERKRLLEDQYDEEAQRKEEERRKMEKRIKDQINSVSELTEEEEITYVEILKSLKEQTKGKEEEVANLLENLLDTN